MGFLKLPKTRIFNHKRYTIAKGFLSREEAKAEAKRYRAKGYKARIIEKAGELHFIRRFHIYIAK